MPQTCRYVRQHLVVGRFNDSSKTVTFTIQATTSDYEKCIYPGTPSTASGQRCVGVRPRPHPTTTIIF